MAFDAAAMARKTWHAMVMATDRQVGWGNAESVLTDALTAAHAARSAPVGECNGTCNAAENWKREALRCADVAEQRWLDRERMLMRLQEHGPHCTAPTPTDAAVEAVIKALETAHNGALGMPSLEGTCIKLPDYWRRLALAAMRAGAS